MHSARARAEAINRHYRIFTRTRGDIVRLDSALEGRALSLLMLGERPRRRYSQTGAVAKEPHDLTLRASAVVLHPEAITPGFDPGKLDDVEQVGD